jgi:hypothetical protein
MTGKMLLAIAVVAVAVCAVALHLFGPEFMHEIHGGKLWPW